MFKRKPRCYIMGPYSSPEGKQEENTRRAICAGEMLATEGFVPYIPHLTHHWELQFPHPWKFWIDLGLHYLLDSQLAVRLVTGTHSAGADIEQAVAETRNIPVFYWNWTDNIRDQGVPQEVIDWRVRWARSHDKIL